MKFIFNIKLSHLKHGDLSSLLHHLRHGLHLLPLPSLVLLQVRALCAVRCVVMAWYVASKHRKGFIIGTITPLRRHDELSELKKRRLIKELRTSEIFSAHLRWFFPLRPVPLVPGVIGNNSLVTKAWSLMILMTSRNLILLVMVCPWNMNGIPSGPSQQSSSIHLGI